VKRGLDWRGLVALAAALVLAAAARDTLAQVANTKHNLSVSGPGTVKAATESQVCIFCHTPHNAAPAAQLWNRRNPTSTYTPYTSTTAKGGAGQPNGASLLCLSCHDGTIALGEVLSRATPITMAGAVTTMPAGNTRLGTDLGDDHPVSFAYTATLASQRGGELVNPGSLSGPVKLDAAGRLQCTTCHDPHGTPYEKFLVVNNAGSALCRTCHAKPGWAAGSHATASKTWNGLGPDPWPSTSATTVADNGCENCHRPHSAPGRRFLLHQATEEGTCFSCHNGNVATKNIQAEFNKLSRHAVSASTGVHDPTEPALVGTMHVECVDCHNPHASKAGTGTPAGALTNVRGVDINGAAVTAVTAEYQVCFRCHADSTARTPAPLITRQIAQPNIRLKFQTNNPSLHALAGTGTASNVPSLVAPWTTSSVLKCSDCHNNNAGPGAGGTGPNGPHGSTFRPLLERQYILTDNTSYSAANYALCFKCHSSTSILGNATFKAHNKHISGERTPCSVCHDPHGVPSPGTTANNGRLINFNTAVVTPSSSGLLRWEDTGNNAGRCYLTCHGKNHNPLSY
jgi:predicted CXXCH cytochrome family protein